MRYQLCVGFTLVCKRGKVFRKVAFYGEDQKSESIAHRDELCAAGMIARLIPTELVRKLRKV